MTTKTRFASIRAASVRLAGGIAVFAGTLWLADLTGGGVGRGLVFLGFGALTMALHAALKSWSPAAQRPRNADSAKT